MKRREEKKINSIFYRILITVFECLLMTIVRNNVLVVYVHMYVYSNTFTYTYTMSQVTNMYVTVYSVKINYYLYKIYTNTHVFTLPSFAKKAFSIVLELVGSVCTQCNIRDITQCNSKLHP